MTHLMALSAQTETHRCLHRLVRCGLCVRRVTDEEIEGAIDDGFAFGLDDGNVSNEYVIRYARAIEQALKEKNT